MAEFSLRVDGWAMDEVPTACCVVSGDSSETEW